jgi:predicted O-methyltransferase YrrM
MRFWAKRTTSRPAEELLAPLPERFRTRLLSMYAGEPQLGPDGKMHEIDATTRIGPEQGMWLYQTCRELKPKQTAEIGLAYGFSAIYFLAAIHETGNGFHTSIDPLPGRFEVAIGPHQADKLDMKHAFRFIKERSYRAMVDLARGDERFELMFIDGSHRFDDALVDFTLAAELCPADGYIVLDDMWMPSLQRAASFIRKNRTDFAEIKTPVWNIAAFKRIGTDGRKWDHYAEF